MPHLDEPIRVRVLFRALINIRIQVPLLGLGDRNCILLGLFNLPTHQYHRLALNNDPKRHSPKTLTDHAVGGPSLNILGKT